MQPFFSSQCFIWHAGRGSRNSGSEEFQAVVNRAVPAGSTFKVHLLLLILSDTQLSNSAFEINVSVNDPLPTSVGPVNKTYQ